MQNAVTIATNMAGRGTDIILGGNLDAKILLAIKDIQDSDEIKNITEKIRHAHDDEKEEVKKCGGLFVMGSERHESRRIDNQLRGRSGRLGDIGESQFFLALDDDLLRIFGGDRIGGILAKLGLKEGEPMNHHMLNSAITRSQQKLEGMHYEMRKNVLKYDTIMNEQREIIYRERLKFIESDNLKKDSYDILAKVITAIYHNATNKDGVFSDIDFEKGLIDIIGIKAYTYMSAVLKSEFEREYDTDEIVDFVVKKCTEYNENRFKNNAEILIQKVEKFVIITSLDEVWKDHLYYLNHIKEAIHLRAYAQKDPLVEYKMESFNAFEKMFENFRTSVAKKLMHVEIRNEDSVSLSHEIEPVITTKDDIILNDYSNLKPINPHKDLLNTIKKQQKNNIQIKKIGRNDHCFCGSGKKFKSCCNTK